MFSYTALQCVYIFCPIIYLHISTYIYYTYYTYIYFVNGSVWFAITCIYRINSILLAIMSLSIIYLAPILYMYIKINFTVIDTVAASQYLSSKYNNQKVWTDVNALLFNQPKSVTTNRTIIKHHKTTLSKYLDCYLGNC